jgi:hypothetical protein
MFPLGTTFRRSRHRILRYFIKINFQNNFSLAKKAPWVQDSTNPCFQNQLTTSASFLDASANWPGVLQLAKFRFLGLGLRKTQQPTNQPTNQLNC